MTGPHPARTGPDLALVALVVLATAIVMAVRVAFGSAQRPLFGDTDDAMRIVVVRDLLAGQNWYDLVQHRLNTPFGAEIHWSRLIDLPLALLLGGLSPLLGSANATIVTGYLWPLALLGVLLWVSARLAYRLVGPEGVLPALILPVLSPAITAEFTPGRVDHHNVVIILTLALAWTAIEARQRQGFAIAAGLIAATAMAIAIESLPLVLAVIIVIGLFYVAEPQRKSLLPRFGIAFALGAMAHLALARPPARWLEAACDMLSPVYVGVAIAVGIAYCLVFVLPTPARPWQRLALMAVLGGLASASVVLAYPQCLAGPYGQLDPWLQTNWIAGISEAKPWFASLPDLPSYTVAVGAPALLGTAVILYRLWREPAERPEWAALLFILLCAGVVMLSQVRGARLAVMPAMPAAAWLIVHLRHRYLAQRRIGPALGLVAAWLAFSGIVLALVVGAVSNAMPGRAQVVAISQLSKAKCLLPSAFTDLAALPPEAIMTPIDLGAHLLLETPHAVVAAPYHRNEAGVLDAFRFFNEPIETARDILEARNIGLVVTCPAMPELAGRPDRAPDSFVNLVKAGTLPPWLVDVSLTGPLKVYAILPR